MSSTTPSVNDVQRPVMLYHGSKYRLAPWIIENMPEHRVYVEPFAGAAGVLMRKAPSYHEVYNDLDERMVTVFRVLRDPEKSRELTEKIRLTPFSRAEYERCYEPADDPVEVARRVITSSNLGFGAVTLDHKTGFRAASRKCYTTQQEVWNKYPDSISRFCERLKDVVIECRPALEIIEQQDRPRTLFYLDPPYDMGQRDERHQYAHEYDKQDHRALADAVKSAEGMVMISGYRSDLYDELYGDWERYDRDIQTQNPSETARESLWLNPKAERRRPQRRLL